VLKVSDYYTPFPRQRQFHESEATYRLFGGAAGPGKTKALLWEAVRQANRYPKVDTLLLRRTYPELEDSLIKEFRRSVPRELFRSYNEAKHLVQWHNGSTTRFGYSRNENDIYQYQGAEFLFIGLDELTHFTLKQWQFLTSRNRCPVPGTKPNMAGASNPGNIGHAWVKALFIDNKLDAQGATKGFDRPEQYRASDYEFIPARIDDNPIYANDANYRRTLEALPENLRRAFLEGDWNVFAGQYFDIFDLQRHTERTERIQRQPWWKHWISIDWGFEHPSAVYWHSQAPPNEFFPWGRVITYREMVQNRLSPRMLGQAIAERTEGERISDVYLSPDAFAHRTAEASIAEQLGEVLSNAGLPQPSPADDDRIGGWQLLYSLLESERWLISDSCGALIACLPGLVRDQKHVEDIAKVDGDDPADSARYGLAPLKQQIAREPVESRIARRMAKSPAVETVQTGTDPVTKQLIVETRVKDMTNYAIHMQKVESEESRKFVPKRMRPRYR